MVTSAELEDLYKQTKYREMIGLVNKEILDPDSIEDEKKLLQSGWAHHQLGEYDNSITIFVALSMHHSADTEIGESARRGEAHGVLQRWGHVEAADALMRQIPPSLSRDNLRMNIFIMAARKGLTIPAEVIVEMATNALKAAPYAIANGHIVNNGTMVLYEARNQEAMKPYLPLMPAFIFAAIGIYKATGAAENHIAGAKFRASQVCEERGWLTIALALARQSTDLWEKLVSSQDGVRYQQNLENAEAQLKKLRLLTFPGG